MRQYQFLFHIDKIFQRNLILYCYQEIFVRNFCGKRHNNDQVSKNIKSNCTKQELITPLVKSLTRSGSVIISAVDNIYDNLSLEEWIYRNYDFSINNEQILLLWHNKPTVVVGRHQNVWLETSIDYCRSNGIDIARRNSGGGTVYHDLNNLNISFLTSRKCYNRTRNLSFIRDVLKECFQIETEISPRKDLIISDSGLKISGTASKLNGYNSYHHCTLLVDVDRDRLRDSLRRDSIDNVKSNATKSIPSPIINLNLLNKFITIDSLIEAISENYRRYYTNANTSGKPIVNRLDRIESDHFSSINDIREMFQSWQWIFGSTPKFIVSQKFWLNSRYIYLELVIEKGIIRQIFDTNYNRSLENIYKTTEEVFIGTRFEESDLKETFEKIKQRISSDQQEILTLLYFAIFTSYKKIVAN